MKIKTIYTLPNISWRHNFLKLRKINVFLADSRCPMLDMQVRISETFQSVSLLAECMCMNEPAKIHQKNHPHRTVRKCNEFHHDIFMHKCHLSLPAVLPMSFFHFHLDPVLPQLFLNSLFQSHECHYFIFCLS